MAARAYRELLVAQRTVFRGDLAARASARAETRAAFRANADADPSRLDDLLRDASDAAGFLLHNVAQTVLNERGNYGVPPSNDHIVARPGPATAAAQLTAPSRAQR